MAQTVQEIYAPRPMAASGQVVAVGVAGGCGGFFCSTSGNVQLRDGPVGGNIIVATFPVTAGVFHALPFGFSNGLYAELNAGATGTFGIQ